MALAMPLPGQVDWATQIQPHFQSPVLSVKASRLSSLWAGYGSVNALQVQLQGESQPRALVVKDIRPPRGSGVSHDRKISSYRVEECFYRTVAPALIDATGLGLPRPLTIQSSSKDGFQFVLSDLREEYPVSAPDSLDEKQVRTVLSWLADYHAYFWGQPCPQGLQAQGSYWYLDTRQDEFNQMGREWAEFKAAAVKIDERLKSPGNDEFVTCIHGDMKNENILFTRDGAHCAAYDFQYTGRSYGVRDVVYLFASSVGSADLRLHEDEYLAHYHSELVDRLTRRVAPPGSGSGPGPSRFGADTAARYHAGVMRRHFDLALLDYVRFMAGWGMWGSGVDWAVARARALLPRVQELLQ